MGLKTRLVLLVLLVFTALYSLRFYQATAYPFKPGDRVRITARLNQLGQPASPSCRFSLKTINVHLRPCPALNYQDQLTVEGVIRRGRSGFYLEKAELKKIKPAKKGLLGQLLDWRQELVKIFLQTLPQPHASLLIGIVLGVQQDLPQDFYQSLKATGTLHIIVASGMNITLLAGGLQDLLAYFLKRKPALIVSLLIIFIYAVIAGLEPPIVRASLMAGGLYLAQLIGRESSGLWILNLTGMLMLIVEPLLLLDLGFQLSFAATAGLISCGSFFQRRVGRVRGLRLFAQEAAEAVSAFLFTLPILILAFGELNPATIIPNILIVGLVPYLMYLGLLIIFFGLVWLPLGQIFSWLAWLPLNFFIQAIYFFDWLAVFNLKLFNN